MLRFITVSVVISQSLVQCVLPNTNAPNYNCLDDVTLKARAQENTFGYSGLAWLTGNICADSFLPPGKIGEFMGFQFIRDSEPNGMGHNSQFSDYISQYMFTKLTDDQLLEFKTIQYDEAYINNTKFVLSTRQDMSNQLRELLVSKSSLLYLNQDAVADVYGRIQQANGEIILRRAKAFGRIVRTMSPQVLSEIRSFFATYILAIPSNLQDLITSNRLRLRALSIPPGISTTMWDGQAWNDPSLLVTLGNQLMAWLTDDVGVYFAPEEVADVFGAFYLKDMEVFNVKNGSTVNLDETANRGDRFLALLTPNQRDKISSLAKSASDQAAVGTLWQIKAVRVAINAELRKLMKSDQVDQSLLSSLHYQLGRLDCTLVSKLASTFTEIYWTMNVTQAAAMRGLRDPSVPNSNCPNQASAGGSWLLATPVKAPLVHPGQPSQIWRNNTTGKATSPTASVPPPINSSPPPKNLPPPPPPKSTARPIPPPLTTSPPRRK